jgi:proteasome lid subunit RPN8/RPN11
MPQDPVLRFSPTAWAKLLFFCHRGDTEVGGFGISDPEDLFYIRDFQTVHQVTSSVTVAFDDTAVADFYEAQVDLGRQPQEFSRLWLHTHPGQSPSPSSVDEETFQRVFGDCDWAVMAILAKGGKTYARLRFNIGPGASILIPVQVDYGQAFDGSDWQAWQEEFDLHVHPALPLPPVSSGRPRASAASEDRGTDITLSEMQELFPEFLAEDSHECSTWPELWESLER